VSREHAIARKLCALYPSDRWAFLRQVRTATGVRREGERIADVVAVALWPCMEPRVHHIEIKDDPDDFGRGGARRNAGGRAASMPWRRAISGR
jgi:hypothetical protein